MAEVLPALCGLIVWGNFVFASAKFEDANAMQTMFAMPVVLLQSAGEVPVVELVLK